MPDEDEEGNLDDLDRQRQKRSARMENTGDNGPRRRRPTAVGTSGGKPFRAGQSVHCKILAAEPGGYTVEVIKGRRPGFLPTDDLFRPGDEVLAYYVCESNGRSLLSCPPGRRLTKPGPLPLKTDVRLRRAVDLFPPPIGSERRSLVALPASARELAAKLESSQQTGILQVSSAAAKARAAALFHRGKVVGCTYSAIAYTPRPTEQSIRLMLALLKTDSAEVMFYRKEEPLVVSMSSLFIGTPVEHGVDLTSGIYLNFLMSWLERSQQTSCIAVSKSDGSTVLICVHNGRFIGAYYVDAQELVTNYNSVYSDVSADPTAVLSPTILGSPRPSGYKLSDFSP